MIATEKKIPSPLVDETTLTKVDKISENIGVVYAGMGPDARYFSLLLLSNTIA